MHNKNVIHDCYFGPETLYQQLHNIITMVINDSLTLHYRINRKYNNMFCLYSEQLGKMLSGKGLVKFSNWKEIWSWMPNVIEIIPKKAKDPTPNKY